MKKNCNPIVVFGSSAQEILPGQTVILVVKPGPGGQGVSLDTSIGATLDDARAGLDALADKMRTGAHPSA